MTDMNEYEQVQREIREAARELGKKIAEAAEKLAGKSLAEIGVDSRQLESASPVSSLNSLAFLYSLASTQMYGGVTEVLTERVGDEEPATRTRAVSISASHCYLSAASEMFGKHFGVCVANAVRSVGMPKGASDTEVAIRGVQCAELLAETYVVSLERGIDGGATHLSEWASKRADSNPEFKSTESMARTDIGAAVDMAKLMTGALVFKRFVAQSLSDVSDEDFTFVCEQLGLNEEQSKALGSVRHAKQS